MLLISLETLSPASFQMPGRKRKMWRREREMGVGRLCMLRLDGERGGQREDLDHDGDPRTKTAKDKCKRDRISLCFCFWYRERATSVVSIHRLNAAARYATKAIPDYTHLVSYLHKLIRGCDLNCVRPLLSSQKNKSLGTRRWGVG